ncbi:hypothetical protein TWF730_008299 [Orbilia blumenaviensis]|uniref:Ricin B lectin domain-containing protein n=1 Tax=Orbilia blumenaviensis TaxID=1796055 RepID=A0AAV9V1Y9_9PEZI
MSLETGIYFITSNYSNGAVGRNTTNDGEHVFSLPPFSNPQKWEIVKLRDGYSLRLGGHQTAELNGMVHALTHDQPITENWDIKPHEQHGPNIYTIEKLDGSLGWVMAADEAFAPISVQPIFATESLPPRYLPPYLFQITKVDRD